MTVTVVDPFPIQVTGSPSSVQLSVAIEVPSTAAVTAAAASATAAAASAAAAQAVGNTNDTIIASRLNDPTSAAAAALAKASGFNVLVGADPTGVTSASSLIQTLHDTVRDAVRAGFSKSNIVAIPSGEYNISTGIVWAPYVKLMPLGQVVFKWTGGTSGTCLLVAPKAADPSPLKSGLTKEQDQDGTIIDGGAGGLTIRNAGTIGGSAIALEVGARSSISRHMARYEIANVAITNFDVALKLNTYDHYVGTYRHLHIEGNTQAIQVGNPGVGSVNTGENFIFAHCVIAGGTNGILVHTYGFDATFVSCSLDFLDRVATINDGYGQLNFIGGHIEAINYLTASQSNGVIVCTATTSEASVAFQGTTFLVSQAAPWFIGSHLKVTGTIEPRWTSVDVNMPYPAAVPAQPSSQPLVYGLKNTASMNRRILTLEHNRVPDPTFLGETTAAAKTSGDLAAWTVGYFGGASIEVLGTNVDTPFTGGKSLKIVMPLGSGIILTHKTAIPLRDLEERWGYAVLKTDIANPNFTVAASVLAPDGTQIELRSDVSITGIGALPTGSWQMPRFLGLGANMPAMIRASAFKPRYLISNSGGNSGTMTVTIPYLYYGQ